MFAAVFVAGAILIGSFVSIGCGSEGLTPAQCKKEITTIEKSEIVYEYPSSTRR